MGVINNKSMHNQSKSNSSGENCALSLTIPENIIFKGMKMVKVDVEME
jgi:hypothetical protein